MKYAPTDEEMDKLKDPPFPAEELSNADQFTWFMHSTIFRFTKRVEIMLFVKVLIIMYIQYKYTYY